MKGFYAAWRCAQGRSDLDFSPSFHFALNLAIGNEWLICSFSSYHPNNKSTVQIEASPTTLKIWTSECNGINSAYHIMKLTKVHEVDMFNEHNIKNIYLAYEVRLIH